MQCLNLTMNKTMLYISNNRLLTYLFIYFARFQLNGNKISSHFDSCIYNNDIIIQQKTFENMFYKFMRDEF